MTTWQRAHLFALGRAFECSFISGEAWATGLARWFPGKALVHLPVGSNIPCTQISREAARARLGIRAERVVLGMFGTAHPSRMLALTREGARSALSAGHDAVVLYVGPHARLVERQ